MFGKNTAVSGFQPVTTPKKNPKNMQALTTNTAHRRAFVAIAMVFTGILSSCSDDDKVTADPSARIPFLGNYQVKDQNSEESQYFSFTLQVLESSKGADKVELKNFRYINNGLYGTISGNKLTINQVLEDSDERVEVTGEGTLNGETLTYSYKIVLKEDGEEPMIFENTAEATKLE